MLLVKWINFAKQRSRSHPRADNRNLIRYTDDSGGLQPLISNLVNISEGGLQLSVRRKIPVGTLLNMVINLVEKDQDLPVVGKVVWVKPIPGYRGGYRAGVAFQEVNPNHRETLREIVEQQGSRKSRF